MSGSRTGGTWTSSNAGVVTIGSSSGIATGVSAGTSIISYYMPGCGSATVVTVVPAPPLPLGTPFVCTGASYLFTDAAPLGYWTSNNSTIASVGSLSGYVTGISGGTAIITYHDIAGTGCAPTTSVTIVPTPGTVPIYGPVSLCGGTDITITNGIAGGSWASSNSMVASVNPYGVVSGVTAGTVVVSYSVSNSCGSATETTTLTILDQPTIIPGLNPEVCLGGTTASLTFTAPGGGVSDYSIDWSPVALANNFLPVSRTTLPVSPITFAVPGVITLGTYYGTLNVYNATCTTAYSLSVTIVTTQGPITGANVLCTGVSTTLGEDITTGAWSSSNAAVASVGTGGIITGVSAGTAVVSYQLTNACGTTTTTVVVTVNESPSISLGTIPVICQGASSASLPYTSFTGNPIYNMSWGDAALAAGFVNNIPMITTVAGMHGSYGYSGDGSAATNAQLNNPVAVATDRNGNFYIADAANNVVRKISAAGIITTVAGIGSSGFSGDGGPATDAQLSGIGAITTDNSGNLYIGETGNMRVRKVNTAGIISTFAGDGILTGGGDGGPATNAGINYPSALAADAFGNVFIADRSNNNIRKVNSAGIISTIEYGLRILSIATDATGNLFYATTFPAPMVFMINTSGITSVVAGTGGMGFVVTDGIMATDAALMFELSIAVDGLGNLYIAQSGSNRVRIVDRNGIINTLAGASSPDYTGDGGPSTAARLNNPVALAVDLPGNVYIADNGNNVIRKITNEIVLPPSPVVLPVPPTAVPDTYTGTFSIYTNHCSSSYTVSVTVAPSAQPIAGTTSLCSGTSALLSDLTIGGSWSSSSAVATVGTAGLLTGVTGGTSIISYEVTSACGTTTAATMVTVTETPTIAFGSMPVICYGATSSDLTYSSATGNLEYSISWDAAAISAGFAGSQAIISTVAGDHSSGYTYSGDGGAATSAGFYFPRSIAYDVSGSLYVADFGNNVVRKVAPSGMITTVAGNFSLGGTSGGDGGAATDAGLSGPSGVAVDAAGNLYIADINNFVVRKVTPAGIISTYAGNHLAGISGDGGMATDAQLRADAITVDAAGNLFIADYYVDVVRKVAPSGIISTMAGSPYGFGYYGDGGPATNASLYNPAGLTTDASLNLYIADHTNNVVRMVTPAGIITTVAGSYYSGGTYRGDSGPATDAGMYSPTGMAFDAAGNLYISDFLNKVVRKVTPSGIISTVAGDHTSMSTYSGDGGAATSAGLYPQSIAVSLSGNIFIADETDNIIRKVSNTSVWPVSTVPVAIPSTAGIGTYSATCTFYNGYCTNAYPVTVTIAPAAQPISGPNAICTGSSILLNELSTDGSWSSSSSGATVGTTGLVTGISAGTAIISYQVTSACGVTTATTTVAVTETPSLALGCMPAVVAGTTAEITYSAVTGSPQYSISWSDAALAAGFGNTQQNISTIAGNYSLGAGFSGDGGPATDARLNMPWGITLDNNGNLYIADHYNSVIRKVSPAGIISTFAGNYTLGAGTSGDGGPAAAAQIDIPTGIATGIDGSIYIGTNHWVRKVNPGGTISSIAGYSGFVWSYVDGVPATAFPIESANPMVSTDAAGNIFYIDETYLTIRKIDPSGILTTVAGTPGTGYLSYTGDGGPATNAHIYFPGGLANSPDGALYLAQSALSGIRRIGTDGIIITVAGNYPITSHGVGSSGDGGPATNAELAHPMGLCFDADGNMYIADNANLEIRKVSPGGIIRTIAGNPILGPGYSGDGGPATNAQLYNPFSVAVDHLGNVYFSDNTNNVIRKISAYTDLPTSPIPVAVPGSTPPGTYTGNLTVVNGTCKTTYPISVTVLAPIVGRKEICTGTTTLLTDMVPGGDWRSSNTAVAAIGTAGDVSGLTAGISVISYHVTTACGSAYITTTLTVNETPSITFDAMPVICAGATSADISYSSVSGSPDYSLAWSDPSLTAGFQNTVSIITTFAGAYTSGSYSGDGGAATDARLYDPLSIATDGFGNLFIADRTNNVIRKIAIDGTISTVAGSSALGGTYSGDGGPATNAGLYQPISVAVDAFGNIFIADQFNNVIRKVNPQGIISTFAGKHIPVFWGGLMYGYSGDGGAASNAMLNYPNDVATDAAGNLYFSDGNNSVVRMVTPAGIISTIAGNGSAGWSYTDGAVATATGLGMGSGVNIATDVAGNLYLSQKNFGIVSRVGPDGIIHTVAGMFNTSGYSGDGGVATAAKFNLPSQLATDAFGNLYIADTYNFVVRKVTTTGIVTTVAGNQHVAYYSDYYSGDGGPATAAGIFAYGVATDALGNLYIAGNNGNVIRKVSSFTTLPTSPITIPVTTTNPGVYTGNITLTNGSCSSSYTVSVTVAPVAGPISGSSLICSGNSVTLSVPNPAGDWSSSNTSVATVGTTGIVYGVTAGTATISFQFTSACGITTATTIVTVIETPGITFGAMPVICSGTTSADLPFSALTGTPGYTINWSSPSIAAGFQNSPRIITTLAGIHGSYGYSGDGYAATDAQLSTPGGVVVDAAGNIYFPDNGNHVVRKISHDGIISTVAGTYGFGGAVGDGSPATNATLSGIGAIAVDGLGNLYITETSGYRVRKVNSSGIISTIAGTGSYGPYCGDGGPATNVGFSSLYGVAADNSGNVYISDQYDYRVRKINAAGIISTLAGVGYGGYSDDVPATDATLNMPGNLAVDNAGNVYIADNGNSRIRRVSTAGMIHTVAGGGFGGDGGLATDALLGSTLGVSVDAAGNIYIADKNNHSVRKVNTGGIINTIAGNGSPGFSGDGGPATVGQLYNPSGSVMDISGNLYIADPGNNVVRKASDISSV